MVIRHIHSTAILITMLFNLVVVQDLGYLHADRIRETT
jgi:hypothetical protein